MVSIAQYFWPEVLHLTNVPWSRGIFRDDADLCLRGGFLYFIFPRHNSTSDEVASIEAG